MTYRLLNIFLSALNILLILCISVTFMARSAMQAYSDGFYGEGSPLFNSKFLDSLLNPIIGAVYILLFVGVVIFSNRIKQLKKTFWILLANSLFHIALLVSVVVCIAKQQL